MPYQLPSSSVLHGDMHCGGSPFGYHANSRDSGSTDPWGLLPALHERPSKPMTFREAHGAAIVELKDGSGATLQVAARMCELMHGGDVFETWSRLREAQVQSSPPFERGGPLDQSLTAEQRRAAHIRRLNAEPRVTAGSSTAEWSAFLRGANGR